jgi:hypothetical protein
MLDCDGMVQRCSSLSDGLLRVSEKGGFLVRSGARCDPMDVDSPHTMELTPEPRTKNNSSRDLKYSKLTKTFAFILVDDSNPERKKRIGA